MLVVLMKGAGYVPKIPAVGIALVDGVEEEDEVVVVVV